MKTIKTTYKPTANSETLVCYWHPRLTQDGHFTPSSHVGSGGLRAWPVKHNYELFCKHLDKIGINSVELAPVTIEDYDPSVHNMNQHRGFLTAPDNQGERVVVDPIIIRGAFMPPVTGKFTHDGKFYVRQEGVTYSSMTPKQRQTFEDWFGAQLEESVTPQMVAELKAVALRNARMAIQDFISDQEKEIDELEGIL